MILIPHAMPILDKTFSFVGSLTTFQSLDVTFRNATLGDFTLIVDRNNAALDYIDNNTFIWLSAERVLWVKYVQELKGNEDYYVVKGYTAKDILKQRVTDPEFFPASTTDGYYVYSSEYVDAICYDLITKFLASEPSGYEWSKITGVAVGTSANLGSNIDFKTRMKNVFTDISSLCIASELGIVCSIEDGAATFTIREGTDYSNSQRFSIENGKLKSTSHTKDWRSSSNYIVGGGQGMGAARMFRRSEVTESGIEVCMTFVDMRDLETNDMLDARIAEKEAEFAAVDVFDGEINFGQSQIYDNYNLGDFIYIEGIGESRQITGIREVYSNPSNAQISVELGYSDSDLKTAVKRLAGDISGELTQ